MPKEKDNDEKIEEEKTIISVKDSNKEVYRPSSQDIGFKVIFMRMNHKFYIIAYPAENELCKFSNVINASYIILIKVST
jgi:hypothetical protein